MKLRLDKMVVIGTGAIAVFLIFFIPIFIRGISSSDNQQMCHLNSKIRTQSIEGRILNKEFIFSAIRFHLSNGSQATYSQYFFDNIIPLDSISIGDSIAKPLGSLELELYTSNGKYKVSLARPCKKDE